ncbi:MAG: EpsG family protein [Alistipes sp.]|nr:EpsG family protein [Alistipes sp.]
MRFALISIFLLISFVICIDKGRFHRFATKNVGAGVLIWCILALIATFRPQDMPDYENYERFFLGSEFARGEIGFKTYVQSLKLFVSKPIVLFGAVAFLSVGIRLFVTRRLSPFFFGSLLLYIAHFFILHDMIQIRVAIAAGIFLWSTKYLEERNGKKFFLTASIAMLFHYSSIVIFPLWFINTIKPQKYLYLSIIPLSYLLTFSGITIGHLAEMIPIASFQALWKMYQMQMENDVGTTINIFNAMQLLRCLVCFYVLWNLPKIAKYSRYAIVWAKIYTISIAAMVLLSDVPVIAFRVSELYQVVEILLLPTILLIPGYRQLGKLLIICFAGCCLVINLFYNQYIP